MRKWLIRKRLDHGYTQAKVAAVSGISRAYYTQIELNNRTPSPRVAMQIASCLDFDWTCFYSPKSENK